MTDFEGLGPNSGRSAGTPDYRRILVPLDGSEIAEHVLPHVASLAQRLNSEVLLLSVARSVEDVVAQTMPASTLGMRPAAVPVPAGIGAAQDPQPIIDAERNDAAEYLEQAAGRLAAQGLQVQYEIQQGDATEVIIERARQLSAGLIAMTTHGRGGLGRLVFGSVADAVLRRAHCPVLLVRVSQEEQERARAE